MTFRILPSLVVADEIRGQLYSSNSGGPCQKGVEITGLLVLKGKDSVACLCGLSHPDCKGVSVAWWLEEVVFPSRRVLLHPLSLIRKRSGNRTVEGKGKCAEIHSVCAFILDEFSISSMLWALPESLQVGPVPQCGRCTEACSASEVAVQVVGPCPCLECHWLNDQSHGPNS